MVVDRNQTVAPLFWYVYRPLARGANVNVDDNQAVGGFNVALYPNGQLLYTEFNGMGAGRPIMFNLPGEVTGRYLQVLNSQSWWMETQPLEIRSSGTPGSISMFGFVDQPLFICEDLDLLVREPFNSTRGMRARRLRGMLECISEMLYPYGVLLCVDELSWQWNDARPTFEQSSNQPTMPNNWQQGWRAGYEGERIAQ